MREVGVSTRSEGKLKAWSAWVGLKEGLWGRVYGGALVSDRYLGEPLATGRTAEIYAWDERVVLKLFHAWFSPDDVEYEHKISSAVHSSGLRSPEVGEIIEIDGRLGLLYERLEGISLLDALRARPWTILRYSKGMAELHAEIHATPAPVGLPRLKEKLERRIRMVTGIRDEVRDALLSALQDLPEGDHLCHGDFHPGNILLTRDGLVAIDWIDAAEGAPMADLARSSVLVMGELAIPGLTTSFERLVLGCGQRAYRRRYGQLHPAGNEEHDAWLPIIAAARLSEGIEELTPWLREQAERVLLKHGAAL